jgi:hypothetical protein
LKCLHACENQSKEKTNTEKSLLTIEIIFS